MNQKAALIKALLAGEVVSIMTGFKMMGITNVPREVSRCVEQPFNVTVSRTKKEGKTRYGGECWWYEYRLNKSDHNLPGIKLMLDYLKEQEDNYPPKTDKQEKEQHKTNQITQLHQQPTLWQNQ